MSFRLASCMAMTTSTFILVPGAGGDAFYWHRVVPLLRDAGHEAVAVDLPAGEDGAGLAEYADAIAGAMGDRRDVVLVAQSMGAFSAPLAATRGDVSRIVLVAPMIPAPGESAGEFWRASGQDDALARARRRGGPRPRRAVRRARDVPPRRPRRRGRAPARARRGRRRGRVLRGPVAAGRLARRPDDRDRGRPRPAVPARVHARPGPRPARPRRRRRDRLRPPAGAQPPGGPRRLLVD